MKILNVILPLFLICSTAFAKEVTLENEKSDPYTVTLKVSDEDNQVEALTIKYRSEVDGKEKTAEFKPIHQTHLTNQLFGENCRLTQKEGLYCTETHYVLFKLKKGTHPFLHRKQCMEHAMGKCEKLSKYS